MIRTFLVSVLFFMSFAAQAAPTMIRWTGTQDADAKLTHILDVLNTKLAGSLSVKDFKLVEDRMMARHHFQMFVRIVNGMPMNSNSLRLWTAGSRLVQVEAYLEKEASIQSLATRFQAFSAHSSLTAERTMELALARVKLNSDDRLMRDARWTDQWVNEKPVRVVVAKGKHGTHTVSLSLENGRVVGYEYSEFPQAEFSIPALVYPVYEQAEESDKQLPRVKDLLRHLQVQVARTGSNPYVSMQNQTYIGEKMNPLLGQFAEGKAKGFWAMSEIKSRAETIRMSLPLTLNNFEEGGILLEGKYATVSLHPDVWEKFNGLEFVPANSSHFVPRWIDKQVGPDTQTVMVPSGALLGKPLMSRSEAMERPARRLPDHDPASYINDGFDEIQVYYAINRLMDGLHRMGFTDPELSTRPFNAFLYDPDIAMRDNAYYTDDTINFTTYSPKQQNYARDNSTIWHELGHGVMDRLMGDYITLADTGGLSEGMADFVAALIIQDVTKGVAFPGSDKFRIINKIGFLLTNEVHDDGEAYGGTMKDFMDSAVKKWGQKGLEKVTDLTLEAMRLARNHPALTAEEWFNHLLFADELGGLPARKPGELRELLLASLAGRNYPAGGKEPAKFNIQYAPSSQDIEPNVELTNKSPGSRGNPILHNLKVDETVSYKLNAGLKSTETYKFVYPVKVRVQLRGGPLQGAIHWVGEENQPLDFVLNSEAELTKFELTATGKCDEINREDGSCVDFAYIQIWNKDATRPSAKKRFYLRIKNP